MKKTISVLLAIIFMFSLFTSAFAAETQSNNIKLNFDLTYNDVHSATVKAGTVIKVVYNLENASANKSFAIQAVADEIYFDRDFFEYQGDEKIEKSACTDNANITETSWKELRVHFNSSYINKKLYQPKQYMGSFLLKVKDSATGSSTISSKQALAFDNENKEYISATSDLTITVGTEEVQNYVVTYISGGEEYKKVEIFGKHIITSTPPEVAGYSFKGWRCEADGKIYQPNDEYNVSENVTFDAVWEKNSNNTGGGGGGGGGSGAAKYTLTFETNGGEDIAPVSKTKNTTVDLAKYTTSKSGYGFDGWYTEPELTNKVSEIKLTENITVYAKWVKGENGNLGNNYKPDIFTNEHYSYIVGKEDGGFYPNDDITRAETAEMLFRLLDSEVRTKAKTTENVFTDVRENDWFNVSVSTLAKLGVINGRTEKSFEPDEKITRAEFTAMVVRLSDIVYDGEDLFGDISNHWAKEYINRAAYAVWVKGENGYFRPEDSITRAEVVTIINRVLNRQPESKNDLLDDMVTPPDNTDESTWYYLAVQEAVNSHNYELKSDGVHEKWTSLTENPDWANFNN